MTPDSFSDGGRFLSVPKAVEQALKMQEEGADLIDVGGESTRPGATPVSAEEELRRILPVLEPLVRRLKIPVSVDTCKASVAEQALLGGASLVNDVTALRDPRMGEVVARFGVPVILMHMRGDPQTMQQDPHYDRLIPDILSDLKQSLRKAKEAGIADENLLTDPGLGFGKRWQDNLVLIKSLGDFKALGFPVVVGPSRKSFLGKVTGASIEDRLSGTAAAVALAVSYGADVVRVHDVAPMRQAALLADAVVRS